MWGVLTIVALEKTGNTPQKPGTVFPCAVGPTHGGIRKYGEICLYILGNILTFCMLFQQCPNKFAEIIRFRYARQGIIIFARVRQQLRRRGEAR